MKKFILRWRERKTRIVRSVTVTVDDQDAWLFRNHVYRVAAGSNAIIRSSRKYGNSASYVQLSHDIMGPPPEGHNWVHRDKNPLNCRRANYTVGAT